MKEMKILTVLFGIGLAGVAVCLVMTVVTGVSEYREKNTPVPLTLPTPAIPHS